MSEELRPCPFCGGKAVASTFFDWDDLEYMPLDAINDCEVTCENERCINGWYLPPEDWNTRPIEDDLRKRIAELEKDNDEFRQLISNWSILLEQDDYFQLWHVESVRQAMLEINKEREE